MKKKKLFLRNTFLAEKYSSDDFYDKLFPIEKKKVVRKVLAMRKVLIIVKVFAMIKVFYTMRKVL